MGLRVLVCGGRDFDKWGAVLGALDSVHYGQGIAEIIHGAARGADRLAGQYARLKGIKETAVPADWNTHGRKAGPLRNEAMLALKPDLVVAFPGGRGTAHMVSISERAGIPVRQCCVPA